MAVEPPVDPFADTRPIKPVSSTDSTRPIRLPSGRKPRSPLRQGCLVLLLAAMIGLAIYFLMPLKINTIILGTDSREAEVALGRTDTIILTSVQPLRPRVGMLSVPRDLWVQIPGVGENRINAAFFFAEAQQPGSGPAAVIDAVAENFHVRMDYYLLVQFNGLEDLVDALGGVEVELLIAMSGYEAGQVHLDGAAALAFVRDRAGTDDFSRLERGQIFARALFNAVLSPQSWPRLPYVLGALPGALETDMPYWQWPRLGLALLRAGPDGIDMRVITREMATPFTTDAGASVLNPHWDLIRPLIAELFD